MVFANNIIIVLWVFMALWMAMLLLITFLYLRDGFKDTDPHLAALAMGFFWLFGTAGSAWAFSQPRTRVDAGPGRIVVRERYLLYSRTHHYSAAAAPPSTHISKEIDDGEATYSLMLETPQGRRIPIVSRSERHEVETERERFLALWSGP
ncbi:hypothetical protein [Pararhizobium sp.]|uniref:hypothetical protein n=1 Tax=Pararhizobium sp. TaxID=1977563 RepID=UPI00271AB54D|nr:hypothetical protein [Pararhizobium sp.]MDO9414953.1 hypothetical protein [Pararhizobium sp.]